MKQIEKDQIERNYGYLYTYNDFAYMGYIGNTKLSMKVRVYVNNGLTLCLNVSIEDQAGNRIGYSLKYAELESIIRHLEWMIAEANGVLKDEPTEYLSKFGTEKGFDVGYQIIARTSEWFVIIYDAICIINPGMKGGGLLLKAFENGKKIMDEMKATLESEDIEELQALSKLREKFPRPTWL